MLVSIKLMGGLGNQLFQIFTTIAYSINSGRKFIFPYSVTLGSRVTYWDTFLKRLKIFTTFKNVSNEFLLKLPMYGEPGFEFNEIPGFNVDAVLLVGYYQSYKYFVKEQSTIFSMIQLEEQKQTLKEKFNSMTVCIDENTVSMHFRYGDYKNLQGHHPLMPYEYYENALKHIVETRDKRGEGFSSLKVFYFCETVDIDVVMEKVNKLKEKFCFMEFIRVEDTFCDWEQMLLMSICRDNIIANSTFSWWGAYFNQTENKIVCYPNRWFGPLIKHDTRDLFPRDWSRISC
jgi:hypothetical protein